MVGRRYGSVKNVHLCTKQGEERKQEYSPGYIHFNILNSSGYIHVKIILPVQNFSKKMHVFSGLFRHSLQCTMRDVRRKSIEENNKVT